MAEKPTGRRRIIIKGDLGDNNTLISEAKTGEAEISVHGSMKDNNDFLASGGDSIAEVQGNVGCGNKLRLREGEEAGGEGGKSCGRCGNSTNISDSKFEGPTILNANGPITQNIYINPIKPSDWQTAAVTEKMKNMKLGTSTEESTTSTSKNEGMDSVDYKPPVAVSSKKGTCNVFISYQWGSKDRVVRLHDDLTKRGFNCWRDESQMVGGDSLLHELESAISSCSVFLACVTPKYVISEICKKEVNLAFERKKRIIPVIFEKPVPWPPEGNMGMCFSGLMYIQLFKSPEDKHADFKQFDGLCDILSKVTD